ncbi:MAG: hypothetical protein ACTHQE_07355 [Thermomicrobiales bacterium]
MGGDATWGDDVMAASWGRVFILGGPGSGKTTLGQRLAAALDAPFHALDTVGYEGGAGAEREMEVRLRDIAAIAIQERWVAEGTFIGWTEALAVAADAIVVLDLPWRVARYRIVMRHVKASVRRSNPHAGMRKLWNFVQDSKRYYEGPQAGRLQTAAWVEPFAGKVVTCRTDRDVEHIAATVHVSSVA